jgi:serine/threonine protein kinase
MRLAPGKTYKVYIDGNKRKYIIMKRVKVYLNTIKGKYRYVQKGGAIQSKMYDLDGNMKDITNTFQNKPLFRKYVPEGEEIELLIVKKIQEAQAQSKLEHVVKIYNINDTEKYYDAELLDTTADYDNERTENIRNALKELHEIGIIYIDLKNDNIGKGEDGKWKIFDFNFSGICNTQFNKWTREPDTTSHSFRTIDPLLPNNSQKDLRQFDKKAYCKLFLTDKFDD